MDNVFRRVSLDAGSVRLIIENQDVSVSVAEIEKVGKGEFRFISAANKYVFADKFYDDTNEAIKFIKTLVPLGWTWL